VKETLRSFKVREWCRVGEGSEQALSWTPKTPSAKGTASTESRKARIGEKENVGATLED
jgi:hypothetical protein